MKYRKKPALTEATQWFKNGDHPQDRSVPIDTPEGPSQGKLTEGEVIKHFRSLNIPGGRFCPKCGNVMQKHGLFEGINGEETVCPGDYVVTNVKGKYYILPAEQFEAMFEPYTLAAHPSPHTVSEVAFGGEEVTISALPAPETPDPMTRQT